MESPAATEVIQPTFRRVGELVFLGLVLFAVTWTVARACVQSITLDEAMSYRAFVAPLHPEHWTPHSNNHVLNSLLIRLSVTVFGLSQFTVRLPALAGACLYLGSCYFLCRAITSRSLIRIIVFICLTFNPYIADYYAVARGYSLALGFLVCAIAVVARSQLRLRHGSIGRTLAVASALIGLSFVANFTFAFVDATTLVALSLWVASTTQPSTARAWLRLITSSAFPGLILVLLLASWTLSTWPAGQLFDGSHSLAETLDSVVAASLHEPNIEVVNPLVAALVHRLGPYLLPLILGTAAAQLVLLFRWRGAFEHDLRTRRTFELCIVASSAPVAALFIHWIAFHLFGLLLPHDRTALYIAPLCTLAVGTLAALSTPGIPPRSGRTALIVVLCALAFYDITCLRMSYVREWWLCADMKDAYYVLAWYNHRYKLTSVPTIPPFTDTMEFYRRASGQETLEEFKDSAALPYGKDVYVFYESQNRELIASQPLKIVYHGRIDSDLVVAIRPAIELSQLSSAPPTTAEIRYDDADPHIQYEGKWVKDARFGEPENGTVSYSDSPGAAFKLRFTGTSLRYMYTRAPNRGTAEVAIDGQWKRTIDLYSPTIQWRSSTSFEGLGNGEHVLEVSVGQHRNPASNGGYVDVDLIATAPAQ